jgi:hypothetical protein
MYSWHIVFIIWAILFLTNNADVSIVTLEPIWTGFVIGWLWQIRFLENPRLCSCKHRLRSKPITKHIHFIRWWDMHGAQFWAPYLIMLDLTHWWYLIMLDLTHWCYLIMLDLTHWCYLIMLDPTHWWYLIMLDLTHWWYLIMLDLTRWWYLIMLDLTHWWYKIKVIRKNVCI